MSRQLLDMVHRANVSLKKSDDHCVTAAVMIAKIKKRVIAGDPEAEGLGWEAFSTQHFERSWSWIKKLAAAGESSDPAKAIEKMRAMNGEAVKRSRAQAKTRKGSYVRAPKPVTLDEIWKAFLKLSTGEQRSLIERIASHLGFGIRKKLNKAA